MQFSKRLPRLLALSLLLVPMALIAQNAGVYATFSLTDAAQWDYGATVGGYDEFNLKHSLDFLRVGGDARITAVHANQTISSTIGPGNNATFNVNSSNNLESYMIGPEISFKTHITPLRPYAEVLVGLTHASAKASLFGVSASDSSNNGTADFLGGLDWTFLPHLAWRALEINYSKFGGGSDTTFSSGLVLRLP